MADLTRIPVSEPLRQRFITEIREAFRKSHEKEYGLRKHPILPVENIEKSFGAREYRNILRRHRYRPGNRTQSLSGKRHKNGIPKFASGKHNPPVTKNAIFIFIPTSADFISSSPASVATKPLTGKAKKPAAFPQKREKTFSDSKKPRISRLRPAVPPASGDFPISPRFFPPEQKRISPCRQKPA